MTETGPAGYTQSNSAGCSGTAVLARAKTCTITNDDIQPKLIVIKHVINDNGGTKTAADFTMTVTGTSVLPAATFPGAESPGTSVRPRRRRLQRHRDRPGRLHSAAFSAGCSGTIALGETKTCTITNDDQPAHLIVIKHVINDNGGTKTAADFTMTVTATSPSPASFPGAESPGTNVALNAGAYNVTESGPAGYTETLSAGCSGTAAIGETKTCTITNDDIPATLTVIKHVINDNGGTKTAADFAMAVTGTSPSPASFPGAESPGTTVALNAGAYNVTETARPATPRPSRPTARARP